MKSYSLLSICLEEYGNVELLKVNNIFCNASQTKAIVSGGSRLLYVQFKIFLETDGIKYCYQNNCKLKRYGQFVLYPLLTFCSFWFEIKDKFRIRVYSALEFALH